MQVLVQRITTKIPFCHAAPPTPLCDLHRQQNGSSTCQCWETHLDHLLYVLLDDGGVGVGLHRYGPVINHGGLGVGPRGGAGVLLWGTKNQKILITPRVNMTFNMHWMVQQSKHLFQGDCSTYQYHSLWRERRRVCPVLDNKSIKSISVCSSPLAFEVLSVKKFGRSPPLCGTGPETPAWDRGNILSLYYQLSHLSSI